MISQGAARNLVLEGSLKRTAKQLLAQGLDCETIATSLEVPVEMIEALQAPAPNFSGDDSGAPGDASGDSLNDTEARLRGLSGIAIGTIEELLSTAESDGVRFAAAKFALEAAHGSLRPKQAAESVNSLQQINIFLNQATERYKEQLNAVFNQKGGDSNAAEMQGRKAITIEAHSEAKISTQENLGESIQATAPTESQ